MNLLHLQHPNQGLPVELTVDLDKVTHWTNGPDGYITIHFIGGTTWYWQTTVAKFDKLVAQHEFDRQPRIVPR